MKTPRHAFTLIELLTVIAIIGVLAAILVPVVGRARLAAQTAASTSNLRQLAAATHAYIADNRGYFPPGASFDHNTRWHGGRNSDSVPYDSRRGWLAPYFSNDGRLKICPVFENMDIVREGPVNFDNSSGGYGYNMTYLGPQQDSLGAPYKRVRFERLPRPGGTIMFGSSAIASKEDGQEGLHEYAFVTPPWILAPSGVPTGMSATPSVHFRFNGKALIVWCDGRVSAESPNEGDGYNAYEVSNYLGGAKLGWFGPTEANGYWNPWYPEKRPRP